MPQSGGGLTAAGLALVAVLGRRALSRSGADRHRDDERATG